MLTAGFGFNGITGSLGVAGTGEPLDVLLLGGTVDLWVRSRGSSLHGFPLGCFAEPWLPTGSVARRIVERHECCSSGAVDYDQERMMISERLILAFFHHAGKSSESVGHIIHDLRKESNAAGKRTVVDRRGVGKRTRHRGRFAGVPLVGTGRFVEMQGELTVGFGGVGKAGLSPEFRAGKDILIALGGPFRQRHPRHPFAG